MFIAFEVVYHSSSRFQIATILHGLASLGWDLVDWMDVLESALEQQGQSKESWLPEEVAMLAWSTAVSPLGINYPGNTSFDSLVNSALLGFGNALHIFAFMKYEKADTISIW